MLKIKKYSSTEASWVNDSLSMFPSGGEKENNFPAKNILSFVEYKPLEEFTLNILR